MAKIFNIEDIPQEYLPLVGGKARGLNSLIKFGFSVPQAFIITDVDENSDLSEAAEKYVRDTYGEVSVRSSATLEDGKDFSAAGQFSTYLNIEGTDTVISAVKSCIASLHNATAQKYSKVFLRSADCRMTVIVQKMVKAKCAGVIFSRAPMRPGYVLVEAVPGLGENLVSGKMSAQQYRVRGKQIEKMPKDAILTPEQAIALGEAGKKAEKLFGQPMDLEWAIDENDNIQWLQARPITIGESVTMNELDCDIDATKVVYTTGNIGEVMPGAVTPLTISTNMLSLDWGVMKTYLEIGCLDEELPPYHFIAPYYNHMFFNMTNMYAAAHCIYGFTKESTDVSICGMVLKDMPDSDMKDKSPLVKLKNMIPFLRLVLGGDRAVNGMKKVISELSFNLDCGKDEIYQQILDNFKYLKLAHYYHYGASYYSGGASAMLSSTLDPAFPDKEELTSLIAGALTQIDDFESADILKNLGRLAIKMLDQDPSLATASYEELDEYFASRANAEVKQAYDNFMERHGYRGILENELMNMPWRDNRESFYTSLKSVLLSCANKKQREETPWTEYADRLLAPFKGAKKKSVKNSLMKARKGVRYREFTKSRTIMVLDQFKQAYRKLSNMMVEEGMLPDVESIYFLTQDEVGRLLKGEQSLVKKAMARRRLYPQQKELKFPYAALGVPQPISVAQTDPDATVLQGTPVSRGIASGIARVVADERDAALLQKGEIMVAHYTDIGWSPYYSIISGLVTEIGSALSHGVVVAREYALPTVVNTPDAMNFIHTGDKITIDGNTGSVIIDERAEQTETK